MRKGLRMDAYLLPNAQLPLFSEERLPHKPYCSNGLEYGVKIRSLRHALSMPYIQVNPPHLCCWMLFDIDREQGGSAWIDAGLPTPYWTAQNVTNGHAHTAWGLSAPVLKGDSARNAPIRYLTAIEYAYRELLQADPNYTSLITKNPLSGLWRLLTGANILYTLDQLAQHIELPSGLDIRKYRQRHEADAVQYGLGRNCYIFDVTRKWAYRAVRQYRGVQGGYVLWLNECIHQTKLYNGELLRQPMSEVECNHIGRSIAKYCWRMMVVDAEACDARFSAKQAARGQASGKARGDAQKGKKELAMLLYTEGKTQVEVAKICGVSQQSISKWLKEAKEVASGSIERDQREVNIFFDKLTAVRS